jgi:Family of unknown function (DUF6600)
MTSVSGLNLPQLISRVVISIAMLCLAPLAMPGSVTKANAQVQVSVEFRTALKPYGQWRHSRHWGDIWIPAHRGEHWRPYTVGHWVYTDDYGWYWITDDREADWGWVTYHYGRWVLDADLGWVWIAGNEWAPAWVTWRRGHDHIGWAPLPPDRIVVEYRERPDVWIFVRARDFTAPAIVRVALPLREQRVYVRQTVIVNRTVVVHDRGPRFAVNPGIAPTIVAAISGRPLHAYQVRPHVLAGTARLPNAVEVRAQDLQSKDRAKVRVSAQETKTTIQPEKNVPQPKPLAAKENGRLGEHPPKAAQAAQQQNGKQQPEGKAAQEQKQGEEPKSKAVEQKKGEEPKSKAAVQKKGEEPKSKAAEQKKSEEPKSKAAEQKKGEEPKSKAAEQKKSEESKAKAAEQKRNGESKAKAAEQKRNEESKAKAAEQKHNAASKPKAAEQHAPPKKPSAERSENGPAHAAPAAQQHKAAKPETVGRGAPPAKRPQPQDEKDKPEH